MGKLAQVPLVIDGSLEKIKTTKKAVEVLKKVGAYDDVERCKSSKHVRAGQGKMRNRRQVIRRGPLVVYNEDEGIRQAFRNLPGVDLCSVHALNLLQLAPGGHVGRLIIWTADAFKALDAVFDGPQEVDREGRLQPAAGRHGQRQPGPHHQLERGPERVRVAKPLPRKQGVHKNPLTNLNALLKLNPYASTFKRNETLFAEGQRKKHAKVAAARK